MKQNLENHILTVYTRDEVAQILILDSQFHLRERAIGDEASFKLSQGAYIVQVKSGSEMHERALALQSDCSVYFEPTRFQSPVSFPDITQGDDFELENPSRFNWESIRTNLGTGSKLYVFGNSASSKHMERMVSFDVYPGISLTLRDFDDQVLVNFSEQAVSMNHRTDDCWLACVLDVKPGNYVLCVEAADGSTYKQTIVTCKNWQTQVFLELRDYGLSQRDIGADLFDSSILMSRMGDWFDPREGINFTDGTNYRLTEQVRQSLGAKRDAINRKLIQTLTSDDLDNPMLGLYSAYLLIQNSSNEFSEVKAIVKNLRRLLGTSHPDVEALALKVGIPTDFVFTEFPMFAGAWKFILEGAVQNPALVPVQAVSYRLSGQFWSNECWLVWGKSRETERRGLQVELANFFQQQSDNKVSKVLTKAVSQVVRAVTSNRNIESKVEKYLPSFRNALDGAVASLSGDNVVQLTQNLGIPSSRISELISGISALDLTSTVRTFVDQAWSANDDPQKGRWGGKVVSNSRRIRAYARKTKVDSVYDLSITVSSTKKDKPLSGKVQFYLHDTFLNPSPVIAVVNGSAVLKLSKVWGGFTVGAVADDGMTQLELDLSTLRNVSDEFRSR